MAAAVYVCVGCLPAWPRVLGRESTALTDCAVAQTMCEEVAKGSVPARLPALPSAEPVAFARRMNQRYGLRFLAVKIPDRRCGIYVRRQPPVQRSTSRGQNQALSSFSASALRDARGLSASSGCPRREVDAPQHLSQSRPRCPQRVTSSCGCPTSCKQHHGRTTAQDPDDPRRRAALRAGGGDVLRRQHRADRRELRRDVYRRGAALARQGGEKTAKKAWNRYWKKDKFCEAAGVRDADCKRYLELSRRHRDELSYDEEDELAALQKRIHQGGARAVRPERTMQPWEARLRRLSSVVEEAPQPQQVRRKKKTRVGRPRSAADNSLTAKRLKDVRNRERRELAARTEDGSLASQVSHDGDVRAHLAMTRAADNATSIPEAAMLVAPPIEFLHPQGLPPQHLLVPVRNHHPPEWVKPTGKSPPPSLEATSVNDTASLTTVETAATTGTAMTPGTLDTPERHCDSRRRATRTASTSRTRSTTRTSPTTRW